MIEQRIRNFTPHPLSIIIFTSGADVVLDLPSEGEIRVQEQRTPAGEINCVPCTRVIYGAIAGLPVDLADGDVLVVSLLCVPALRGRLPDTVTLATPGVLVRDEQGRPTGCMGLTVWDNP